MSTLSGGNEKGVAGRSRRRPSSSGGEDFLHGLMGVEHCFFRCLGSDDYLVDRSSEHLLAVDNAHLRTSKAGIGEVGRVGYDLLEGLAQQAVVLHPIGVDVALEDWPMATRRRHVQPLQTAGLDEPANERLGLFLGRAVFPDKHRIVERSRKLAARTGRSFEDFENAGLVEQRR